MKIERDPRKPYDAVGREIKVGDFVAYAAGGRGAASMNGGKVTKLTLTKAARSWVDNLNRERYSPAEFKIQIERYIDNGRVMDPDSRWTKFGGKITLQRITHVVVVDLPEDTRFALEEAGADLD